MISQKEMLEMIATEAIQPAGQYEKKSASSTGSVGGLVEDLSKIERFAIEVRKAADGLPLDVRRKISTIANIARIAKLKVPQNS